MSTQEDADQLVRTLIQVEKADAKLRDEEANGESLESMALYGAVGQDGVYRSCLPTHEYERHRAGVDIAIKTARQALEVARDAAMACARKLIPAALAHGADWWNPVIDFVASWDPARLPAAKAKAMILSAVPAPPVPPVDGSWDLVDLDEIAALVKREKRSLERYVKEMPLPFSEGVGGMKTLWKWSEVRPWAANKFNMPRLPETTAVIRTKN